MQKYGTKNVHIAMEECEINKENKNCSFISYCKKINSAMAGPKAGWERRWVGLGASTPIL